MKTDALQFFSGGNDASVKRMDCTRDRDRSGVGTEFATNGAAGEQRRPFRKVLEEVAAENETAQRVTGETVDKKTLTESRADHDTSIKDSAAPEPQGAHGVVDKSVDNSEIAGVDMKSDENTADVEESVRVIDGQTAEQAETIVRDALTEISDALGITIFQGLENLSLQEISGDAKGQFAEIVFILKKLVQGFELGKATGMSVETPNGTLDGAALDKITDVLRSGAFRIEVACNVLGIAGEVGEQVAVKFEQTAQSGIIQAIDPKSIAMSAQHTERLFGGLFTEEQPSEGLATLIDKVRKLIAGNGEEPPVVTVGMDDGSAKSKGDARMFETRIYRAVLKIDKAEQSVIQNHVAAAAVEGGEQPKIASGVPMAQSVVEAVKNEGNANVVSVADVKPGIPQPQLAGNDSKIQSTLMKMTDDTVMEQITGKMHAVIRSGLSEVRVQLRPESLGEVTMRIRIEGDVVQAKIEVQNQQVKEIMERSLPALRDALAQHNLASGSIDIQVGNGLGRHSGGAHQGPWSQQETAQGSTNRQGKEQEDAATKNERKEGAETGRRFGSNSVEYFA